jgi:hypothetical protein
VSPVPAIVAIALVALLLAGCGEETTIINQTTTTVSSPAAGDTTVVVETAPAEEEPAEEVAPVSEDPSKLGPAPKPRPSLSPNSEDYSGPCGEQGVVNGGKPGASATTAVPGYANLTAEGTSCGNAIAAATGWLAAWEGTCAAGCSRRIEGMSCDYSGSGSLVECTGRDGGVRFALVFEFS